MYSYSLTTRFFKRSYFLCLAVLFCLTFSNCSKDCDYSQDYTSFLFLYDSSGMPVVLDSFNLIKLDDSTRMQIDQVSDAEGCYTIMDNGQMPSIGKLGEDFTFNGFVENGKIIQGYSFIKNDCHIVKLSGPDTLIIPE